MAVDFDRPWPDKGHEAIRLAILDHLDQLRDAFLIGETTADGLTIALSNFVDLQQQVVDLTARVAALETPPAPAPTPDPPPDPPPATNAFVIL